nr:DsbA family protein [Phyllobacterium phragmitis]
MYSDYVCPFCLLAEQVLSDAIGNRDVAISWRAFELRPEPVPTLRPEDPFSRPSGIGPSICSPKSGAFRSACRRSRLNLETPPPMDELRQAIDQLEDSGGVDGRPPSYETGNPLGTCLRAQPVNQ